MKFRVHDSFQKASADLKCKGSSADHVLMFRKEAGVEEPCECPHFKCFMRKWGVVKELTTSEGSMPKTLELTHIVFVVLPGKYKSMLFRVKAGKEFILKNALVPFALPLEVPHFAITGQPCLPQDSLGTLIWRMGWLWVPWCAADFLSANQGKQM